MILGVMHAARSPRTKALVVADRVLFSFASIRPNYLTPKGWRPYAWILHHHVLNIRSRTILIHQDRQDAITQEVSE